MDPFSAAPTPDNTPVRTLQDAILGFLRLSRMNREIAMSFYRDHGMPFGERDVAVGLWIEYAQYTTPN